MRKNDIHKRDFWKSFGKGTLFVGINFALAILIIVIIIIWLNSYLHSYTDHGVEVTVPDLKEKVIEQAETILAPLQLHLEVIDSTYSNTVPFGTIVEQDPTPNSHVKHGRTIYVTVNASGKRKVTLPDLHDISYRQAETTLRGLGLVVDEQYEYEPSEYRDLVLDIKVNDESVQPGEKIDVGTTVRLVVGFGRGTEQVAVPSVIGMTLTDARSVLLQNRLTVGAVNYDEEQAAEEQPQEAEVEQYVYRQSPNEGELLIEGESVTLYLSSDIEKSVTDQGGENEEENWF